MQSVDLLLSSDPIAAHSLSGLGDLGDYILRRDVCDAEGSEADGKSGPVPTEPVAGGRDHGGYPVSTYTHGRSCCANEGVQSE